MKWHVSEKSIYDESGALIIEASEWYMREELLKICDEHNKIEYSISNGDSASSKSKGEYVKEQFIKIEDARIAICEAVSSDCRNCALNSEDKCGDIKNLGVFNIKTMKLEPLGDT